MKMLKTVALSVMAALSFVLALVLTAAPAHAQATRTWVSGVGDDVNPCSRTAPCKTFAGAISKTAAGGEINCLDPGGFGTVTITKSITIDCEDTQGSILASSTNGVNVNDSATGSPNTIKVILRGLSINGAGTTPGLSGVAFLSGASLTIEDCIIQNFTTSPAAGVRVTTTTGAQHVRILNSHIVNNSAAATGGGIFVQPSGTAAIRVDIDNVQMVGNTNAAVRIDTSNNTGTGIQVTVSNSLMAGSSVGLVANQPAGKAQISVMVSASEVSNNTTAGIFAAGANARVRIGGSSISNNATAALVAVGGVVNSYGNNQINGNTTIDGTFVAIPLS